MDEPIDRALARAAEGPEDGIDLDEVAAIARRRRRRRRLTAGAGVLLLVVAVPAMVALGNTGADDPQVVLDQPNTAVSPPPEEDPLAEDGPMRAELELREDTVLRCGAVDWRVANHGEVDLRFGVMAGLQRWDGETWQEVPALPPGAAWSLGGYGASAGETGEWHELRLDWLDHVEPGWYRLTKGLTEATGEEEDDENTLGVAAIVEVVADDRENHGICGPSAEELAQLDPADEGRADITGDGNPDAVSLYEHDDGASLLVETAAGQTAVALVDHGMDRDYDGLGSRGLDAGEVGLDLAGDGRQEVLVRSEKDGVDSLRVFAWDDGDLRQVHPHDSELGRWTLQAGLATDGNERHWLECTEDGVRYHRAGPIDDEDASFAHRADTYRLSDGVAERLDHSEEHVDELPDEPLIDCIR